VFNKYLGAGASKESKKLFEAVWQTQSEIDKVSRYNPTDAKGQKQKTAKLEQLKKQADTQTDELKKWATENPYAMGEAEKRGALEDKTINAETVTINAKSLGDGSTTSSVEVSEWVAQDSETGAVKGGGTSRGAKVDQNGRAVGM
jgi:hypothetical protein